MSDREKIIKDLEFCVNGRYKVELSLAKKILVLLQEQPEIVRCKDCKHGAQVGMLPLITCGGVDHGLDWFCADGRRR